MCKRPAFRDDRSEDRAVRQEANSSRDHIRGATSNESYIEHTGERRFSFWNRSIEFVSNYARDHDCLCSRWQILESSCGSTLERLVDSCDPTMVAPTLLSGQPQTLSQPLPQEIALNTTL